MSMPGDPDATMPVPGGGEPTQPAGAYGGGDATTPATGYAGGGQGPGGGDDGYDGEDEEGDDRRKLWMIAGGVLVLGVLVGALIAVLASGGGGEDGSTTSTSSSTTSSSTSTSTSASTTLPPTTTAAGPQILQFVANPNPVSCPNNSATINVNLTWSTQNAQSVTVAIDNPNQPFGTYQPSGQQQVPFNCGANPVQHTYYLIANGSGGQKTQKQIVVPGNVPPSTTTSTT